MTPLQLKCLQLLAQNAYVDAQRIATVISPNRAWWPQAATRWGCGYVKPLIKAGYVSKLWNPEAHNWFMLTRKGKQALEHIEFARAFIADVEKTVLFGTP